MRTISTQILATLGVKSQQLQHLESLAIPAETQ